jgi:hypothetical protein
MFAIRKALRIAKDVRGFLTADSRIQLVLPSQIPQSNSRVFHNVSGNKTFLFVVYRKERP